eukprot:11177885-Lingulodinium_polyedra.AAC.1
MAGTPYAGVPFWPAAPRQGSQDGAARLPSIEGLIWRRCAIRTPDIGFELGGPEWFSCYVHA